MPLIIFDLDGTLVDAVEDIATHLNATLAEAGLPTHSLAEVRGMVGEGARVLVRRASGADGAELDALLATFLGKYRARPAISVHPYPEIAETLERLEALATLTVATNKVGDISRAILEHLGLAPRFGHVLGPDDVGARKPDPAVVERLLSETGAERGRTLYVGDSPIDFQTARAAGVRVCLVTWGLVPAVRLRALGADYYIDRASELIPLVAAMAGERLS